ncbi:hypothetical protein [Daejeonella lutea]|uniref:Uncharacterized protein n=1 Tax=Daejeonella lutea TaxID=572036 RepID=A0A1T5BU80_9SPHI|nr:hypothetical protein [Daejeonella lutea]SKB50701.1 hypothetical protein SAMN05661099_1681 [Daejeonella lutea]
MKPTKTTAEKLLISFDKQLFKLLKSDLNILKSLNTATRPSRKFAA